jgi:tRNA(Ile)-lysidine synthase
MAVTLRREVEAVLAALPALAPDAGGKLLVGVSGGPDSLALLHVLRALLGPARLAAAHVNHGLRPTAVTEAAFVAETAVAWGVACYTHTIDAAALAREQGWTLEEAGRRARYQFFARLNDDLGATAVAVGHNADDQAETVLMHLLRGSGLTGLRGMLPVGPLPGHALRMLLRPLLRVPRAAIEAYCRDNDLQPICDHSNEDTTFFRNRVRHDLLPVLAGYSPRIGARLRQLADLVAADEALLHDLTTRAWADLVQAQGEGWLRLDRAAFAAAPLSLQRRLLRRAVQHCLPAPREVGLRALEQARRVAVGEATGPSALLPGGVRLTVDYNSLHLALDRPAAAFDRPGPDLPQLPSDEPLWLPIPGHVDLAGGWRLEAQVVPDPSLRAAAANRDPWRVYVDVGPATALAVRARRPGERMQPLGMHGRSAKIKALMINRKLPAALRPRWPLVAAPEQPVWLVGQRLDRRARVTPASARVVLLRCYRA